MALATAPATCHRCKGAIAPGDDIRRYNRPAVGTLYHATCPTLAPAAPLTAPATQAPSPLDLDALAAALASRMPSVAPLASPAASEPSVTIGCGYAECPDTCADYSHNLVCDGYEDAGFDCAGHNWIEIQADASVTLDMRQDSLARDIETLAERSIAPASFAFAAGANPTPADDTWDGAFADACNGADATDTRALLHYSDGMRVGLLIASRIIAARVETPAPAKSRAEWLAEFGASGVPLAFLADDAAADAAMAGEAKSREAATANECTCHIDDTETVVTVGPCCAARGAQPGAPFKREEHCL